MLNTESMMPDLIEQIPEPQVIRASLSQAVREVQLLRQLLRLAERTAKNRERDSDRSKEKVSR